MIQGPDRPLWLLPAAIALIPFVAGHLALVISAQAGHVPECLPYLDGCTSISRAGRHGLANHLFRLLMLPCALLQALHWVAARDWLRIRHADAVVGRGMLALGVGAALALAVYVTFLGSEGEVYRWLRRYGVTLYFAGTYLAQLLYLRALRPFGDAVRGERRGMLAVALGMLALGLGSTAVSGLLPDDDARDRIENALEWYLGLFLTAWFLLQAKLWRRSGFRLRTEVP